jgi:hypothetical protein
VWVCAREEGGEGEEEERLRRVNVPPMSLTPFPVPFQSIYEQQRKRIRTKQRSLIDTHP